jgi:hypothetical protein
MDPLSGINIAGDSPALMLGAGARDQHVVL